MPTCRALPPNSCIPSLFNRQNEPAFAKLFDDTLIAIAAANHEIFAVRTEDGEKVPLFDRLSEYITGSADKRDGFVPRLFNKLVGFSFERLFDAEIRLLRRAVRIPDQGLQQGQRRQVRRVLHAARGGHDHGRNPRAASQRGTVKNVTCYDPASGSGTLLMALAHAIGEDSAASSPQESRRNPPACCA